MLRALSAGLVLSVLCTALGACGQKGPLYLPVTPPRTIPPMPKAATHTPPPVATHTVAPAGKTH